jgi:hypothetical protein
MEKCANGIETTPLGQTGLYFICQFEENKGNPCRFCRWCGQTNEFVLATDKNGKSCQNVIIK